MKKREIIVDGDVAYVPLTQGMFAVIDSEFANEIGKYNWYVFKPGINKRYYAATHIQKPNGKQTLLYMHRAIWEFRYDPIPDGLQIDHHEREYTCDNRLINLRLVDPREQRQNQGVPSNAAEKQSKFVGVSWHSNANKWVAHIKYNGKSIHLGYYDTDEFGYSAYYFALQLIGANPPINHKRYHPQKLFISAKTRAYVEKQLLKYGLDLIE